MYVYGDYLIFNEPIEFITLVTKASLCKHYKKDKIANHLEGLTPEILNAEINNLEWFVGFSEAEGMFFISKEGNLNFRINLHSDDLVSLEFIKNLLSKLANRDIGSIVRN